MGAASMAIERYSEGDFNFLAELAEKGKSLEKLEIKARYAAIIWARDEIERLQDKIFQLEL